MKLRTPVDADPEVSPKVRLYKEAFELEEIQLPSVDNPVERPVPGVEYDEAGFPRMPSDLTAITSQDLGRLFQAIQAWNEYITDLVSMCDREKEESEAIMKLVKAEVKKGLKKEGLSQKECDEYYRTDYRFIDADTRYVRAKANHHRLDNARSMISKRFSLVSREITRRGEDFEQSKMDPDKRFQENSFAGNRIKRT